jgi:hypothetical protein
MILFLPTSTLSKVKHSFHNRFLSKALSFFFNSFLTKYRSLSIGLISLSNLSAFLAIKLNKFSAPNFARFVMNSVSPTFNLLLKLIASKHFSGGTRKKNDTEFSSIFRIVITNCRFTRSYSSKSKLYIFTSNKAKVSFTFFVLTANSSAIAGFIKSNDPKSLLKYSPSS